MNAQNKLVLIASHDFPTFPMDVHGFLDSVGSFLLPLDPTSIDAIMEQQSICMLILHSPFNDSDHQKIYQQACAAYPKLPIVMLLPEDVHLPFLENLSSERTFCHWAPYDLPQININLRDQIRSSDSSKSPRPIITHKHGIVGQSEKIQEVLKLVDVVAPHKTGVLIEGESGTGKELFAQAIHQASKRKGKFVGLNCGAIPRELLESELFGHARGSFSGANADKRGLFEEAADGTIFLDEIPELDPLLQVKLTRVMQERQFRRVGDNKLRNVEARFIAATNKNLKELVDNGQFREDLYFRLSIFPIQLPPLRERIEDIPLLAEYFVDLFNKKFGREVKEVSSEVLLAMNAYPWPGNLREMVNMFERSFLLQQGNILELQSFPELASNRSQSGFWESPPGLMNYKEYIEDITTKAQRRYVTKMLKSSQGNISRAAEEMGLKRESLHRLLKRLDINAKDFR